MIEGKHEQTMKKIFLEEIEQKRKMVILFIGQKFARTPIMIDNYDHLPFGKSIKQLDGQENIVYYDFSRNAVAMTETNSTKLPT